MRAEELKLVHLSVPAKALVSAILMTMAIAMTGALGQIIVHDIIPTFFAETHSPPGRQAEETAPTAAPGQNQVPAGRGDLFAETPVPEQAAQSQPFYQSEQFVWTLRWTHIHLFGMNMIFIFMGAVTLFLDLSARGRTWLIVLPFAGVILDIAGMWLKGYFSSAFFWLHIPGGGLFGAIFILVFFQALWEMWAPHRIA
ncbi:MAG: hypothetical protein JSW39_23095 [Desulfobacterales bacterium]|nr:MAG: hypothetical protein JSW39_23095 [Desulfobacterales bacterium]